MFILLRGCGYFIRSYYSHLVALLYRRILYHRLPGTLPTHTATVVDDSPLLLSIEGFETAFTKLLDEYSFLRGAINDDYYGDDSYSSNDGSGYVYGDDAYLGGSDDFYNDMYGDDFYSFTNTPSLQPTEAPRLVIPLLYIVVAGVALIMLVVLIYHGCKTNKNKRKIYDLMNEAKVEEESG